jgi:hypothetical protein
MTFFDSFGQSSILPETVPAATAVRAEEIDSSVVEPVYDHPEMRKEVKPEKSPEASS